MRKKSKGTTKCEKRIVTHNIGTAQCEDKTVKYEKKNKGTTKCEKRIVKCEDETVKYEEKSKRTTKCKKKTDRCDVGTQYKKKTVKYEKM